MTTTPPERDPAPPRIGKAQLAAQAAVLTTLTHRQVEETLVSYITVITGQLHEGVRVSLPNFGVFTPVTVRGHRTVQFQPARSLLQALDDLSELGTLPPSAETSTTGD